MDSRLVFLITSILLTSTTHAAAQSPFRYDDNIKAYVSLPRDSLYDRLKFLLLGNAVLSTGADLRERVEANDGTLLGFGNRNSEIYDLHRLLLYGDLRLQNGVRLFLQLGNHEEAGRTPIPIPTDRDDLNVQQGFVDIPVSAPPSGQATIRLGRSEMSFDDGAIIGLRDGPNTRLSFDGARLMYRSERLQVDGFAVRPVAISPGVFDDGDSGADWLAGLHVSADIGGLLAIDGFYFHAYQQSVKILGFGSAEATDTIGARFRGSQGQFYGEVGLIGQRGSSGYKSVAAFAAHAIAGLRMDHSVARPDLKLRIDVLSGGNPAKRTLNTFNALYPNVSYSTEATIEAPANLIEPGAVLTLYPSQRLDLSFTFEGLWRYSRDDAFYAAPLFPLITPGRSTSSSSFDGLEQQLAAAIHLNAWLSVRAAFVHFSVGDFLRGAGARDENFGMTELAIRI